MRRALIAMAAMLCACGGGGSASSVTDQGHTLDPSSADVTQQNGGSAIVISDVAGLCDRLTQVNPCDPSSLGSQISTITELSIVVSGVAPATYTVGTPLGGGDFDPSRFAQVQFLSTSFAGFVIDSAVSGTVTVTQLSAGGPASGSYDVTMQQGDHLTGTFEAENCPGLSNLSSGGPVCDDSSDGDASCSNTCTCGGKTVKAACSETTDGSFDCTCTDTAGATTTCHTDADAFVACDRDFGCCPMSF